MARTSRRKNLQQADFGAAEHRIKSREPAAAYVRLSVEEEEGDSIDTQLTTLKNYIAKSTDLYLEDVYIDNGYTGTNFDRPDFNRMMTDVRSGRIRCIVVKDLSRFGRNFLESGYYIETLLPKLNARLIALTDDFDSIRQSDQDALSVPIKNMVNEFYAKDYSKKVSDMNAARRRSGKYKIEKSMYGYSVDKEKDEYCVNPETAPIAQMIFRWYLAGVPCGRIAKSLNLLGIMTPQEYKCKYEFVGAEMTAAPVWTTGKVITVLRRESYVGDRILGVRLTALYKNYKDKDMPRDEWTIYKDNHEPIITREDFARTQEMLDSKLELIRETVRRGREINPELDKMFEGFIYCGSCNRKMRIETKRYNDGVVKLEGAIYVCKGRQGREYTPGCRLAIEIDLLKVLVNDQLQMMISLLLDQQKAVAKIRKLHDEKNSVQKYKRRIESLSFKCDKCGEKLMQLYEDLTAGVIEKEDYETLRAQYQAERRKYEEKILEYRNLMMQAQSRMDEFESIVETLKEKFHHMPLCRELLEYLVEKIIIHDDKRMEIVYKFSDVFQTITEIVEGGDTK